MTDPKQIAETVERYRPVGYVPGMALVSDGHWVRFTDYEALAAENAALKAEAEAAAARLAEVEAERDGFYSDWDAALKLTNKTAGLMLHMDADRLAQAARAEAAEADRDRLAAELAEARAVLDFYSNADAWDDFSHDEHAAAFDRNVGSDLGHDRGEKARAYLTKGTPT